MADFNGSKPVQTVRDNEFKIKVVDFASGATATNGWDINGDGAGLVRGVEFDIRPLVNTDVVTIEDGGGSITVDGSVTVTATDLDIRLLTNADVVTIEDGGGSITVDGSVTVTATDLDIRPLTNADVVTIEDGGGSITVDGSVTVSATDLDIRALSHTSDSIALGDGTDLLDINTDGSINVVVVPDPNETDVIDYNTTATVGVGTAINHDYVITDTKTFYGDSVIVGARGAVKVRIGTYNGTAFTPLMTYFQDPKENRQVDIPRIAFLGDATNAIRIEITNLDGTSSDVYSTLQGYEE